MLKRLACLVFGLLIALGMTIPAFAADTARDSSGWVSTGEIPIAGSVGNADGKQPGGQTMDGSDRNAGWACDRNRGIGSGNPAHLGCPSADEASEDEDSTVLPLELSTVVDVIPTGGEILFF